MKKIFALSSLLVIFGFCFGQTNQQILFDQLYIPGIIAQNPINDILQDQNGLMWFCTNDGIHRYNGYAFETFKPPSSNYALNFQCIYQLNDSLMLLGTASNGLMRFNQYTKKFSPIKYQHATGAIQGIIEDSTHTIWIDVGHAGLFKYENDSLKLFNHEIVDALSISPKGNLYYSSRNKLFEATPADGSSLLCTLPSDYIITSIGFNNSDIWLGTNSHGLFDFNSSELRQILTLDKSSVVSIFNDQSNKTWILTFNDGVFIYDQGQFKNIRRKFYSNHSLTSDRALSVLQDNNDIIWVGTGAGINKYDPHKYKFEVYRHDPLNDQSISSDIVRGIYEDSEKSLWIATEDGSINILDQNKAYFKSIKLPDQRGEKIVPYDFYEIDKKHILVATSHGFFTTNKNLNTITPHPTLTATAFDGSRIRNIEPINSDLLMFLSEGKVYSYSLDNDLLERLDLNKNNPSDETQSVDEYARTIYADEDGVFWIGSYGCFAKIDLKAKEAQYFTFAEPGKRGALVMYLNRMGNTMWVGTFNGGIIKFDLNHKTFKRYNTQNGLPNNSVYAALPDSNGNLWISCNEGICSFNIEEETFSCFDLNDGVQGQEFNRLAYCVRTNGEMALGGINGLNIFHPNKVKINPKPPKSIILSLTILNEFDESNEQLHPERSLIGAQKIKLNHTQNFLRFNFCSSHFSTPSENKFYYQLENYDDNWIYAGTKNSATYTGLNHGNYVFKVKSVSADGIEGTDYATLAIDIDAPFWMNWWFYVSILFLISLLSYITIKRRLAQNKAVKALLELEIDKRTKELKISKDKLSDLNEKKDFIFSILSHDLRSPLTTLEGFLGLIINYYDQMTPQEVKGHAEAIKNAVGKSLDLIDNTLYWSLSQMGNISYNPVNIHVPSLLERVKGLYELTAQKKDIHLIFKSEEHISIKADDNMAYIIIRNLVSNAIKFSPKASTVTVRAIEADSVVSISIKDEGAGIDQESMEKLFDQTPNLSKKGTSNEKGAGLGLILCKKFIDMNSGTISAESNTNGSIFTVTFPNASNDQNPEQ